MGLQPSLQQQEHRDSVAGQEETGEERSREGGAERGEVKETEGREQSTSENKQRNQAGALGAKLAREGAAGHHQGRKKVHNRGLHDLHTLQAGKQVACRQTRGPVSRLPRRTRSEAALVCEVR